MDSPVQVTVRAIAAGGAGVADLPDGRVVFVPRTAPGDRAAIRIEKSRARWAEGSLSELIDPSPERRPALCRLYDRCGGCQLQHLPYARQLEWKVRTVADALERIGRVQGVRPPPVVGSPSETGYRSRVSFTLRRLPRGRVVAGFHALGRPAYVVDVATECVLPRPRLADAWRALRSRWGPGARLLPSAPRLRLTLRTEGEGVSLVVEGGRGDWGAAELAEAVAELRSIWHVPEGSQAPPRLAAGSASRDLAPRFAQVNPEAAELLVEHVVDLAGEPSSAVDAYSGDGAYALELASRGWRVTAIEIDRAGCAAARARAGRQELAAVDVLQGQVEDLLAGVLPVPLLIVNPPRTGLAGSVVDMVRERRPPRVLYVSCDAATLARDVAGLSSTYEVGSVRCFDLFPQTAHVETVLELRSRDC